MSSISQTVPNYVLGISEQPDQLKSQGQVRDLVNGVPDVTRMLSKRPGTAHIREMIGATAHEGHWFSIYKADDQQYIARILPGSANGTVQVWRLVDGPINRYPGAPNSPTRGYVNVTSAGTGYDKNVQGLDSSFPNYDANYNNVTVTNPSGSGTGLKVNCRTDADGKMLAVYINDPGSNWKSGDTGDVVISSKTSTITYYEGIAGEECRVNYDSDYISPYALPIGEYGSVIQPRVPGTNSVYLKEFAQKPGDSSIFKTLTVNDTTIIVNKSVVTQLDTTVKEPDKIAEGFLEVLQLGFEQVYQFNIIQDTGTVIPIVGAETSKTANTDEVLEDLLFKIGAAGYNGQKIGNGIYITGVSTDTATAVTNPSKAASTYNPTDTSYDLTVGSKGLKVRVTIDTNGGVAANSVLVLESGTSYIVSDTETILGSALGGTDGTDDLTLTISKLGVGTDVFSLETPDRQLLSVFTDEVQDITALPDQCSDGYRLKIINSGTLEDDYYVKFEGSNGTDGQGVWTEWRAWPNTDKNITGYYRFDKTTMPHILVGMSDLSFMFTPGNYDDRLIGDENSNPNPSFLNSRINNVCLFRNRLGFLSKQDIILSRPEDFLNFWVSTALAVTPKDPIDLRTSSTSAATLFDSIEVNAGLMLFSKTEQYMLTTDNDVLSAETAKINFVSAYNYNENVPPFTLGTTIGFLNDESSNSRLYEMANPAREGQPEVIEQSKIISSLYPTGINRIATSKNNAVVLTCKDDDKTIWGYRYFNTSERRLQSAWFKFEMTGGVIYHTIIKDTWYGVVRNGNNIVTFQKMDLKTSDFTFNYKDVDYHDVIRLDNKVKVPHSKLTYSNGVTKFSTTDIGYNGTAWTYDQTKVDGTSTTVKCFQIGNGVDEQCVDVKTSTAPPNQFNAAYNEITLDGNWSEQIKAEITTDTATGLPDGKFSQEPTTVISGAGSGLRLSGEVENGKITKLVISDIGIGYTNDTTVRIDKATSSVITIKVTDLDVWVGYEYHLNVEMPTIYPVRAAGQNTRSDVNGSLVLHRCKFNMARVGTYEFELDRVGRDTWTSGQETRYCDSYDLNNAPILNIDTITLPVYDRNINTNIHLKSEYPLPVTLISMTWEGEYTNLSYRRS